MLGQSIYDKIVSKSRQYHEDKQHILKKDWKANKKNKNDCLMLIYFLFAGKKVLTYHIEIIMSLRSNPKFIVTSIKMIDDKASLDEKSMFCHMHHALKKSKSFRKRTIYLVGEIRSGKSTTFNWLTNPKNLVGKGNEIEAHYFLRDEQERAALIKNSFKSVTMVQNTWTPIDEDEETILVDLPGFHDSRSPNEIMLVNYIINTCFSFSSDVKFIIVTSKHEFLNINGTSFINSIKEFVKFFRNFSFEERAQMYKSVSMLVTSVDYKQYDSYKEFYMNKLKENLEKIKEMQGSNSQISLYYHLIEELLLAIINNRRLQLFKMAKEGQSPDPSPIFEQFNVSGWTFFPLKGKQKMICYPYKEYYQKLNEQEKQKIVGIIQTKTRQFTNLQVQLGDIFNLYLSNPYQRQVDLTRNFQRLKQLAQANRAHEDIPKFKQEKTQGEFDTQLMPIKIYSGISQLIRLTFDIKNYNQRTLQEKEALDYYEYLSQFFERSIRVFTQSFTIRPYEKQIMNIIFKIFNEILEELKYITEMNSSLESSCCVNLKEAILITNRLYYFEDQIVSQYLKDLYEQDFQNGIHQYDESELQQTLEFLQHIDWQKFQLRDKFFLLNKAHRGMALVLRKDKEYDKAIQSSMISMENCLKYTISVDKKYSTQAKALRKILQPEELEKLINSSLTQLYASVYMVDRQSSIQIFQKYNMAFIIQGAFETLKSHFQRYDKDKKCDCYQQYSNYYEQRGKYSLASSIYKMIYQAVQKNKKKGIQQKMKTCQSKLQSQIKNKTTSQVNQEQAIQVMNEINKIFRQAQIEYCKQSLQQEIISFLANKKKDVVVANQFDYTLDKDYTNYDIASISEQLARKINKRKVILMLGSSAGKTTAFYWIQKKQLIARRVGNTRYLYDLVAEKANKANQNFINHRGKIPTLVPNIAQIEEGELLIDFSSIIQKKFVSSSLIRYIFTMILQNSQEAKFLMVIKEEELFKNECLEFFKILEYLADLLPEKQDIAKHFALLINYSQEPLKKHSDQMVEFMKEFNQKYKHQETFEEKYGIKIANQKIFGKIIQSIFGFNKIIILPRAKNTVVDQSNFQMINKQRPWTFIPVSELKLAQAYNYLSSFTEKHEQIRKSADFIRGQYNRVVDLLRDLQKIFLSSLSGEKIVLESFKVDKRLLNKYQYLKDRFTKMPEQLFIFNQISVVRQISKYTINLQSITENIEGTLNRYLQLIQLIKKMSFFQAENLIIIQCIQQEVRGILSFLSIFEMIQMKNADVHSFIGFETNDFKHLTYKEILKIVNFDSGKAEQFIKNIFCKLNFDGLLKQMELQSNFNSEETLFKFIQDNLPLLQKEKMKKQAVLKLKQLSSKKKNYHYLFSAQIILFEDCHNRCQLQSQKGNPQSSISQDQQLRFKIELIQNLKESVSICAQFDISFAFSIADELNCDDTRCKIYERLCAVSQERDPEIIRDYMQFCLKLGIRQKFRDLCKIHSEVEKELSLREKYEQINFKILRNEIELVNKKRDIFDNLSEIRFDQLQKINQRLITLSQMLS